MAWPRQIFGIPLHPMLVHFPLVLWLVVPVFDVAALLSGPKPWWGLGLGFTGAGVAIGVLALGTGLLDYVHQSNPGSSDVRLAARHGVRTTVVWCVMTLKLAVAVLASPGPSFIVACLVVDLLACALLVQGAYFGTRITYRGSGR